MPVLNQQENGSNDDGDECNGQEHKIATSPDQAWVRLTVHQTQTQEVDRERAQGDDQLQDKDNLVCGVQPASIRPARLPGPVSGLSQRLRA
jgi:hypothetical protein